MDDIDKLKELRLIQYLSSLEISTLQESNVLKYSIDEITKIKDIINQLIPYVDKSPYIFIEQWSPFGFVIYYRIHYKKKKIFDFSEHYLPKDYNRYSMDELILGEINSCKYTYFKDRFIKKLSDVDY